MLVRAVDEILGTHSADSSIVTGTGGSGSVTGCHGCTAAERRAAVTDPADQALARAVMPARI